MRIEDPLRMEVEDRRNGLLVAPGDEITVMVVEVDPQGRINLVVRNLGVPLRPITTANFDFMQHYRPLQNVVKRPTAPKAGDKKNDSRGYAITGHHEILLPLVAAALASGAPATPSRKKKRKR